MDSVREADITNPVRAGFFVLSLTAFLLVSCTGPLSRLFSKPVVQVNEHVLTAKEMADQLARQLKTLDSLSVKDPNSLSRSKEEIVRNFILQSIMSDYAKSFQISVEDSEVDKEVASVRSSYPDDLAFRRVLAQENLSLSEWRESLKKSLLARLVFAKIGEKIEAPTTTDIKKYFDQNKDRFRRKERVYLRQIVVDDLTKAQSLHDELVKKRDFAELASKYSVSPEGKAGGLVGWIEKGAVDIFDKAFQLPIGGVSPVLESSYGFHIFKVERRALAGVATLDEVRGQIVQALRAQKEQAEFLGWLDKQIRQSRILRNNELIQSIVVETRGGHKK